MRSSSETEALDRSITTDRLTLDGRISRLKVARRRNLNSLDPSSRNVQGIINKRRDYASNTRPRRSLALRIDVKNNDTSPLKFEAKPSLEDETSMFSFLEKLDRTADRKIKQNALPKNLKPLAKRKSRAVRNPDLLNAVKAFNKEGLRTRVKLRRRSTSLPGENQLLNVNFDASHLGINAISRTIGDDIDQLAAEPASGSNSQNESAPAAIPKTVLDRQSSFPLNKSDPNLVQGSAEVFATSKFPRKNSTSPGETLNPVLQQSNPQHTPEFLQTQFLDYHVLKNRIRPKLYKQYRRSNKHSKNSSKYDIFGLNIFTASAVTMAKLLLFPFFFETSSVASIKFSESELNLRINKTVYSLLYFLHVAMMIFYYKLVEHNSATVEMFLWLPVALLVLLASLFTYCASFLPDLLNKFKELDTEEEVEGAGSTRKTLSFPILHIKRAKNHGDVTRRASLPSSPRSTDEFVFLKSGIARSRSFSNSQPSQVVDTDVETNSDNHSDPSGNESDNEEEHESEGVSDDEDSDKSVTAASHGQNLVRPRQTPNVPPLARISPTEHAIAPNEIFVINGAAENNFQEVKSVHFYGNKVSTERLSADQIRQSIEEKVRMCKPTPEALGTVIALLTSLLPAVSKIMGLLDNSAISEELCPLNTVSFFQVENHLCSAFESDGKLLPFALQSLATATALLVSSVCTYLLTNQFFMEISLAELTFLKRFMYAKHFKKLTSSSKAKKARLPHFRLTKASNIRVWINLRNRKVEHKTQRNQTGDASANFLVSLSLCFFFYGLYRFLSSVFNPKEVNIEDFSYENLVEIIITQPELSLYFIWGAGLMMYSFRFSTLFNKTVDKYDCEGLLKTELLNLSFLLSNRTKIKQSKVEEYKAATDIIKNMISLYKNLEPDGKKRSESKILMHPTIYKLLKVIILSALGTLTTPIFGFKVRLWKL
eukprot:snap_masked-scaffold_9-processed-gene-2.25-mRNA-1 protein AED:1.00 eAED:1.00 QI:0/0/0/0/1/1/4/0/938